MTFQNELFHDRGIFTAISPFPTTHILGFGMVSKIHKNVKQVGPTYNDPKRMCETVMTIRKPNNILFQFSSYEKNHFHT